MRSNFHYEQGALLRGSFASTITFFLFTSYPPATFLKWHSAKEPETRVVVLGYWGQPSGLKDNPHPFLCVQGHLKSDTGDGMYAGVSVMMQYIDLFV